jgi:hypothetical protein
MTTIKIAQLSPSELEYLQGVVPEDPTEDQIRHIAEELLERLIQDSAVIGQAEILVRRIVNLNREGQVRQQAIEAGKNYVFAKAHRSSTSMHPVMEQWRVFARDFAAFCKEFDLSQKEMVKVGHGEVDSYKGWRQGTTPGNLGTPRNQALERSKPGPSMIAGPFFGAIRTPSSGMNAAASPVFLPVVT